MRMVLATAGLLVGLMPVFAEEKAAPKPPAEPLDTLVEKLGSRDYKTRVAASRALETYGVEALPTLKKAHAAATNAEARKRLSGIVQNLERVQILSPKRLTIKLVNRPLADVIKEINKQTGYPLMNQGGTNPSMTIAMENATFWEVMDRVCLLAGMTLYHNEGQGLVLSYNDTFTPCVVYRGPFKVVGNNFNYNKTINFGAIPRNPANHKLRSESLTFSFTIHSEFKLPIMSIQQARVLEAVDENGASMILQQNHQNVHVVEYHSYNGGYRTFQQAGSLSIAWPNKEARIVKKLRGVVPVTLLAEQKPEIVVDDVLKVKAKKFTGGNSELQVDEVKETNNKTHYSIRLTARNTTPNAGHDYTWAKSVPQRIELLDAKGRKYYSQGYNYESSSATHMQATMMFATNGDATLGPPVRLVLNQWVMMQHQVEFEFKDLQLP